MSTSTSPTQLAAHRPMASPSADKKPFLQAHKVIALFKAVRAGKGESYPEGPWTKFQLAPGEFDEIERLLEQDEGLWGFTKDKIRYDYDARRCRLIVRRSVKLQQCFLVAIEDEIKEQLDAISEGSDVAARLAQNIYCARSSDVYYPTGSKNSPDTSFEHRNSKYPNILIEVSWPEKRKDLTGLAENWLLDSNTTIQAVVCLNFEYGKKRSLRATLTVFRTQTFPTTKGYECRMVEEPLDELFRDAQGNPTQNPGHRLRLSDFAPRFLWEEELGDDDREIVIPAQQLGQFLNEADELCSRDRYVEPLPPGVVIRRRSRSPSEEPTPVDEARFDLQEETAARRMGRNDDDRVD